MRLVQDDDPPAEDDKGQPLQGADPNNANPNSWPAVPEEYMLPPKDTHGKRKISADTVGLGGPGGPGARDEFGNRIEGQEKPAPPASSRGAASSSLLELAGATGHHPGKASSKRGGRDDRQAQQAPVQQQQQPPAPVQQAQPPQQPEEGQRLRNRRRRGPDLLL